MSSSTNFSSTFTKERWCKGDGFIIEGVLVKHNIHTVFVNCKQPLTETPLPTRFVAIVLEFDNGIKRNWNEHGIELPPKMTRSTAITKGYLNKFDRVQATIVDKVDCDQICAAIANGKPLPENFHDEAIPSLHPKKKNHLEFWADVDKFSHKIFKQGDEIRIKTMGNSIFVESIVKMDQNNMANLAGDSQLGDSFSKNIMKRYDEINTSNQPEEEEDDDEWK
ncbi:hypothetical protein DICPUDRAFT_148371 [Dictyostelium purpureum]|uniref:Arpin n=1 Tax=Dictyostelium purpureum TaxID=5786 RepID=F0ZAY4_DICPU|nr:uncharacterized protein DICPUDRAFT_148371 [Dictyostelium purpureum]EGC38910.1 hypothetical protein DICPUDRAFT_148371 [Dictyostelium purpureum]|eukprot:XP_003284590.1 hypothetical protein DICPUDRAFT_148371 [Dictyostelium purpureum]